MTLTQRIALWLTIPAVALAVTAPFVFGPADARRVIWATFMALGAGWVAALNTTDQEPNQ